MPFRFRKIVSLGKGIRLNLGKTGASFSLGGKGTTVNLGKRGVRTTLGIPGTGISYTTPTSSSNLDKVDFDPSSSAPVSWADKLLLLLQLGMASFQIIFAILAFIATCAFAAFVLYIIFS